MPSYALNNPLVSGEYSVFSPIKSTDFGTIQQALPSVAANTSVDYFLLVRYGFTSQKLVEWARPNSASDPAAILISSADCIAPVWLLSTAITAYNGATPSNKSYVMLNGTLFGCTTAGTTGASVPAFNFTKGQTTADGTAVWTCLGQQSLVRIRFSNTSAVPGTPVAQDYWFSQF
jgi:hypothetical protein